MKLNGKVMTIPTSEKNCLNYLVRRKLGTTAETI